VTGRPALGLAGLLTGTLRLTAEAAGRMFPVAFLPSLASAALAGYAAPAADAVGRVTPGQLWSGLADLVLGTLVAGVLCLIALDASLGKRHGIEEYLRQAARQFLPLLVFGLVLSVAIAVGFVFLILPGLYVAARYFPYVPATVFEDAGWQGTTRAEELTRGYRWPLAAAVGVFSVAALGFFVLAGTPFLLAAAALGTLPAILADAGLATLGYILLATFSAVVYLRLRALREGLAPEDIAATID